MKERKMNNKGFSLVELIIVIAIMAILIVVLAPQYLKYVERSRNSTDLQNATELKTAIETYVADPESKETMAADKKFIIKMTSTGGEVTSASDSDGKKVAEEALKSAGLDVKDIKCSSKTKWTSYSLTGTMKSNGAIEWSYSIEGTDSKAFENAMKGNSGS